MKKLLMLLVAASMVGFSHAREFTSADGEKTIRADFVRYNPRDGKVTLRLHSGRNMVTDSKFFCQDDIDYFKEEYEKEELEGAIKVRSHDKITRETKVENRLLIQLINSDFTFTVKNNSDVDLEDLDVKYWVVTERYNFGKEINETSSGDGSIDKLEADGEAEVNGPHIILTDGAVPKDARDQNQYNRLLNEAAKIGKDRILGWRVEIYNSGGDRIYAHSSSLRVSRHLGVDEDDEDDKDDN